MRRYIVLLLITGIVWAQTDFDILVRKVIVEYGCIVDIYGVKELTANSLIESASKFYSISNKFLV